MTNLTEAAFEPYIAHDEDEPGATIYPDTLLEDANGNVFTATRWACGLAVADLKAQGGGIVTAARAWGLMLAAEKEGILNQA